METSKVCLVTGASSGIGFAIARSLNDDGHKVVVTARRLEKLKELNISDNDILVGDLNSVDLQNDLETHIYEKYDRCDYLFNCAGMIESGTIEEVDIDKMSAMLRLNVETTFRLTYKFLKRFKKQGFGHVVNISSVLGTKVRPTAGGYAATKFAMEALSEALRMELTGTNIKVSCIEPGLVLTELHNSWKVHPKDSMNIHTPLSPDDIVNTVRFIMSQPDHVRIPRLMILPNDHNI